MTICAFCDFSSTVPFSQCPRCGRVLTITESTSMVVDGEEPITLADVPYEAACGVMTGTPLDHLSEHGVPHGAVILLWGVEGSGKSRLALCAADGWCTATKGVAYYTLMESMNLTQLRRMAMEHACQNLYSIIPAHADMVNEDFFYRRERKTPSLFVIDSSADLDTVLSAKRYVTEHPQNTVLMIVQATKDGDAFLGVRALVHECDVEVQLDVDDAVDDGRRLMIVKKNRFGLSGVFLCRWPPQAAPA